MYCGQCGMRNEEGSMFCDSCGGKLGEVRQESLRDDSRMAGDRDYDETELISQTESDIDSEVIAQNENYNVSGYSSEVQGYDHQNNTYGNNAYKDNAYSDGNPKKNGKKTLAIVVGVLLLVAISFTGGMFLGGQNTRAFNDAMEEGHRYLLAENLEQAQAQFQRAIQIRPREVEPYLQLAEIYMAWDEPEEAIAILEQGLEAVPVEDRSALREALDEIRESITPEAPAVEDEVNQEEVDEPEESDEMDPFYLALIAFHEFLSNPQSMVFHDIWGRPIDLSWDRDTLVRAELMDLRGDGIPQLLIVLPTYQFEMTFRANPLIIFEYSEGQMEPIYESFIGGEGGSWNYYHLAYTADGKTYLVRNDAGIYFRGDIESRVMSSYFTLIGEEFTSVLSTRKYVGEDGVEIVVAYVNDQSMSGDEYESALYEQLGIVEMRRVSWLFPEEQQGVDPLLQYIEERLEAAGIDLPEPIVDVEDDEPQEGSQQEAGVNGNPFNLDVWGSHNILRISSSGVTIDAPIPSRDELTQHDNRFVVFGGDLVAEWWYRVDVQIGVDNSTLDAIHRYINWISDRDCTIQMEYQTYILGDLRLARLDVRRQHDIESAMINSTYVISFEHEGQVVVAHINFAGNFTDARKELFFRAFGIDRFIQAGLL